MTGAFKTPRPYTKDRYNDKNGIGGMFLPFCPALNPIQKFEELFLITKGL